jgi:hypothetical protein
MNWPNSWQGDPQAMSGCGVVRDGSCVVRTGRHCNIINNKNTASRSGLGDGPFSGSSLDRTIPWNVAACLHAPTGPLFHGGHRLSNKKQHQQQHLQLEVARKPVSGLWRLHLWPTKPPSVQETTIIQLSAIRTGSENHQGIYPRSLDITATTSMKGVHDRAA